MWTTMIDDSSWKARLTQLATSGDEQAMAELFEQYRPRLSRMVQLRMDRRLQWGGSTRRMFCRRRTLNWPGGYLIMRAVRIYRCTYGCVW